MLVTQKLTIEGLENLPDTYPTEVIYQVYPASFMDSNNDGMGDLRGIISRLNYIEQLGVDAVWISPFFLSPPGHDGDGGYAVSNYREIDPRFGAMADFEELLAGAHARGLKIYTDFVLPHTSSHHEWFGKSLRREAGFEDFYIWHNGKINEPVTGDGGAQRPGLPNNWLSIFGGSAWEWHDARGQYYLHHFLPAQPALNLRQTAVQDAALAEMKFWLDKGVDGFRIDALPHIGCDAEFRDDRWLDPANPPAEPRWTDLFVEYSFCPDYIHDLARRIRGLMRSYTRPRFTLGEILAGREGGYNSLPIAASFIGDDQLDYCYTNELVSLTSFPSAANIAGMVGRINKFFPAVGGNCNTASNHDVARSATRLTQGLAEDAKPASIRQLLQLFICLPGSFTLYQGEELGLPQGRIPQDISLEKRKDVIVTQFGAPEGRDGSRTPMPWAHAAKNAGFSHSDHPYLPIPASHYPLAVDVQEDDPHSLLHFTRHLLAWRKSQPALMKGHTRAQTVDDDILILLRYHRDQTLLCLFNMGPQEKTFLLNDYLDQTILSQLTPSAPDQKLIKLGAFEVRFFGDVRDGPKTLLGILNSRCGPSDAA